MKTFNTVEQARKWFWEEIEGSFMDDFCDNYREAFTDDPAQVKEYEEIYSSGCCGTHDVTVLVDGREFDMGCNYGH